jgi:hypothetical protein
MDDPASISPRTQRWVYHPGIFWKKYGIDFLTPGTVHTNSKTQTSLLWNPNRLKHEVKNTNNNFSFYSLCEYMHTICVAMIYCLKSVPQFHYHTGITTVSIQQLSDWQTDWLADCLEYVFSWRTGPPPYHPVDCVLSLCGNDSVVMKLC